MEDLKIVALYWARSEQAVSATAEKYGKYCFAIAYQILVNREDADESVNDTYLAAWDTIPPHRPTILSTFLGKITRRISLNKWRDRTRLKRGGGQVQLALDELSECIPSPHSTEQIVSQRELSRSIDRFLGTLPQTERNIFVSRYWFLTEVKVIGRRYGFSESKTKSMLLRTREKLRKHLTQEGLL